MHVFKAEHSQCAKGVASGRLWHALQAIDKYLRGQAAWLVNYAKRYRAGERVGTSITEGTANFLVNRRMNKPQQMRWSRNGADLLLQVRCAVYNGTLGVGFGHGPRSLHGPKENLERASLVLTSRRHVTAVNGERTLRHPIQCDPGFAVASQTR
jgi:hypothetical protein